ncbi:hypothetical protein AO261_00645 [Pseudomonas avellanae]|nr:hypothetical protein AO261_00645 [Pseudomonas avellanae]
MFAPCYEYASDHPYIHGMAGHTLTTARQPMAVQHHRYAVQLSGGVAFDEWELTGVKRAGGFIAQHGRWLTVDSVGAC